MVLYPIKIYQSNWGKKLGEVICKLIKKYPDAFLTFLIDNQSLVNDKIIKASGYIIKEVSMVEKNGFANFKFGLSFFVKPHTPFFPFSYHEGKTGFSISYELVNPILNLIKNLPSMPVNKLKNKLRKSFLIIAEMIFNSF